MCVAAELKPEANTAYDRYTHEVEARVTSAKPFLWIDSHPDLLQQVKQGQVVVQPWKGNGDVSAPDALMHDWIGTLFVPGARVEQVLAVLQDYDHHKTIYHDVPDSKLLVHNGNDWEYHRLRKLDKGRINGIFRTDFAAHYQEVSPTQWICLTRSTKVDEIEDYGKPKQHELPVGKGSGYLWRLNGYWKLEQRDNGVYVECEAVSLTRALPAVIGGLFASNMHDLEKESLTGTLQATRDAVKK